jgi:prophage DNA circulation protein
MIGTEDIFESLIPASFRGIPFWMIDSRLTVGRRVQAFLFPGRDDRVYEDLGAFDGPISITGVLVGDDFVSQAQDMRAAMRAPGSAQLLHPWLGELTVILKEPGTVSFDQTTLRLARIEMSIELFTPDDPPAADTLSAVNDDIEDLQTQAGSLIAAVLAPAALTLAAISVVETVCGQVAGIFTTVAAAVGAVASAVAADVALLGSAALVGADAIATPAAVAALLAAPVADIVGTSVTLLPAAIGPGDAAPPTATQDPRQTTAMLLSAVTQIVALTGGASGAAAPAVAVSLAAAAYAAAGAVDAASDIVYTSQQDAQASLASLLAGIDAVATLAVSLAPSLPAAAGTVWRSTQRLRAAVAADINAQIGRLPVVQSFTLAATMPVWLVAQALVGDTPAQLAATYADLIARNNVVNPAAIGPGTIEALVA